MPRRPSSATAVRDATTGELVASVSTEGLDLAAALEYARTVGQASLGALTFHQRAVLLKQMALVLTERKEELYALSTRTGATRNDSWVDIDGGIGVLFTYSSKGRRELPNSQVYVDGAVEPLSKDGSFIGQHIYTRLPGVAVQINAFNFPVWGSLEKFAPAFVAGMPTLVKPATPSGYLAEAMVRILVESGLLPRRLAAARVGERAGPVRPPAARRPRRVHRVGVDGRAAAVARLGADRRRACSRARPTRSTRRCSARMPVPARPSSTPTSSSSWSS